jgi:hypothetical protein
MRGPALSELEKPEKENVTQEEAGPFKDVWMTLQKNPWHRNQAASRSALTPG